MTKEVTKEAKKLRSIALEIIQLIESFPVTKEPARKDWLAPPLLKTFRRLEPIGFDNLYEDKLFFNPTECPPDLVWPINVGTFAKRSDNDFSLNSVRSVNTKEVRGFVSRYSQYMVRMDHAQLYDNEILNASSIWSWIGGAWVQAEVKTVHFRSGLIERLDRGNANQGLLINLASSVALNQRYEWSVSFGLMESPSIRFATDPTGIKDMFRLRDLPEGKDRRESLLTWINDHWRQRRHDPDIEIYVRKHLRGATQFNWKDMNVELNPSQFDIDKRDSLIVEREAMRIAGTDRRPKQLDC
jgi:hypothetical protein